MFKKIALLSFIIVSLTALTGCKSKPAEMPASPAPAATAPTPAPAAAGSFGATCNASSVCNGGLQCIGGKCGIAVEKAAPAAEKTKAASGPIPCGGKNPPCDTGFICEKGFCKSVPPGSKDGACIEGIRCNGSLACVDNRCVSTTISDPNPTFCGDDLPPCAKGHVCESGQCLKISDGSEGGRCMNGASCLGELTCKDGFCVK